MLKLIWQHGRGIGLTFSNDGEYYTTLGYLANSNHRIDVYIHRNQRSGAWAEQGKLENQNYSTNNLPRPLESSFMASGDNRLSVTDYVRNLITNHSFTDEWDPTGNQYTTYYRPSSIEEVRNTVPPEHLDAFERGYNMP